MTRCEGESCGFASNPDDISVRAMQQETSVTLLKGLTTKTDPRVQVDFAWTRRTLSGASSQLFN